MFIPKEFSISPTEIIYFSKGNLQYNLYDGVWRFACCQSDYIGFSNSNCKGQNGWVDLFGWATAKSPYLRSKGKKDYSDVFLDWGINFSSFNQSHWFTLSNEQLAYLLEKRENAINKCALAEIEGEIGLMLLPDEFVLPSGIPFKSRDIDDDDEDYEGTLQYFIHHLNHYTIEEWMTLEALGVVYLPLAGQRYGDLVRYVNESGWYWTSDHYTNFEGANKGGLLLIRSDGSYDIDSYFAPYGCSVRLVRMSGYNKLDFNNKTVKELLELARRSPEIINFQLQCEEIRVGKRKQISQHTIDDAFDAFGIIVKNLASTPDEENELYKYFWKNWLCGNLKSHDINITE